jgi:hypothetical protein
MLPGIVNGRIRGRSCRELAEVNLDCAVGDALATVLERRSRGRCDRVVLGSVPVDLIDVAWWAGALRSL